MLSSRFRAVRADLRVSLVQLCTPRNRDAATAHCLLLVDEAIASGADLIVTPETSNIMERDRARLMNSVVPVEEDELVAALCARAAASDVWILMGSGLFAHDAERCANMSLLIDHEGRIVSRYSKIHLFDADPPGGQSHRESELYRAGDTAVVAATPWGALGMTICYDLRFPGLYRDLAMAGARMITVPAAFAQGTGRDHWETLLRARAIENGVYIFAADQCGEHEDGARTWGRSMVVDPWGTVTGAIEEQTTSILTVTVDLDKVDLARSRVPSILHSRPYRMG